jgi:DNA-binding FadR family transcriptional regulator
MDSPDDTAHRHEVRGLIDPRLARHAALDATEAQKRAFARAHELQARAHEGGAVAAFIEANGAFRDLLRSLSGNSRLAECSAMIDDQAQWARRTAFARADYRALELAHDAELVAAVAQGDAEAAEAAMRRYIVAVSEHLVVPPLDP